MHTIHIPVMGTGFSIDTPIRVAPFGIASVISIMDDILIEKVRRFYCEKMGKSYEPIKPSEVDSRAKRITAYLELMSEIIHEKFESIRKMPFFQDTEKDRYFEMLPKMSDLRQSYERLKAMDLGVEWDKLAQDLTAKMKKGAIEVNIMVKVDGMRFGKDGKSLGEKFSDAKSALRGFINAKMDSNVVFSAGMNRGLFRYLGEFSPDFMGNFRKNIILKVTDFRSALIQGKMLARMGLSVSEYRIESALNCGGHAFATDGSLLPVILKEFQEKRAQLSEFFTSVAEKLSPKITVQGGIGTSGEVARLMADFEVDGIGVATPFLLVPEATSVDTPTMEFLQNSRENDQFISQASPLGVSFNNLKNTTSEQWTNERFLSEKSGSPCPKGYLKIANTEFTEQPICTASAEYQKAKFAELEWSDLPTNLLEKAKQKIVEKVCLCEHLANGAMEQLGITKKTNSPKAVCPSSNISWFDRKYSLMEMMHHFYESTQSLISSARQHVFAKEIQLQVDEFQKMVSKRVNFDKVTRFFGKLSAGIEECFEIAKTKSFTNENLDSMRRVGKCYVPHNNSLCLIDKEVLNYYRQLLNKQGGKQ